ncbi:MAG TPA: hypothetical protein VIM19_01635, partial [Actinomycetes bacterium]
MGRDLGILLVLIALGVLWTLYSAVTRRDKRRRVRDARNAQAKLAELEKPLPGLEAYATAHGWSAPGTDAHLDELTGGYVHDVIRHLWHVEQPAIQT